MDQFQSELQQFIEYKKSCPNQSIFLEEIDPHGFIVSDKPIVSMQKIDLLLTALVHGNEVIGLEIINRILKNLKVSDLKDRSVGFLLCNLEAALAGVRFIESDLNRSFSVKEIKTLEHRRADQIAQIVNRSRVVFDLHQTVEPALTPFFVLEHQHDLIQMAFQLLPQFPIVTFGGHGFSQTGKTMIEYAATVGTKAFVLECGQKGFSEALSTQVADATLNLIRTLNLDEIKNPQNISVLHLVDAIPNRNGNTHLVPGLISYLPIKKGQVLAYEGEKEITAPFDGHLVFPSYGEKARTNHELCNLGIIINYLEKQ